MIWQSVYLEASSR